MVPRKTFSVRALHKIWTKNEADTDNTKRAENDSGSSSEAIDTSGNSANSFSSRALIERIKSEVNDEDDKEDENIPESSELSKPSSIIDDTGSQSSLQSPKPLKESVVNSTDAVPIPAPRKISCQLNRFMSTLSLQMLQILWQQFLIISFTDLLDQNFNQPEERQLHLPQILLMMNLMMKTQSENQRLYLLFLF